MIPIHVDKFLDSSGIISFRGATMLKIENTENYCGVTIQGDYYDLNELYNAISALILDDDSYLGYEQVRIYVLSFLYDLRHAYQGERAAEVVYEYAKEDLKFLSMPLSTHHIYYSFHFPWANMIFVISCLEDYKKKAKNLTLYRRAVQSNPFLSDDKEYYQTLKDKREYHIAYITMFQEMVWSCLKEIISESKVKKCQKMILDSSHDRCQNYFVQFIENVDVQLYWTSDKAQRCKIISKNLLDLIRIPDIFEEKSHYVKFYRQSYFHAKELGIKVENIEYDYDYPKLIVW